MVNKDFGTMLVVEVITLKHSHLGKLHQTIWFLCYRLMGLNYTRASNLTVGFIFGLSSISHPICVTKNTMFLLGQSFLDQISQRMPTLISSQDFTMLVHFPRKVLK